VRLRAILEAASRIQYDHLAEDRGFELPGEVLYQFFINLVGGLRAEVECDAGT
jgi:hypothetical protein